LTKRTKLLLNYLIGPILFIWLSWSIYEQIRQQSDIKQSWEMITEAFLGPQFLKIILVVLLMLLNWGIEARKWQIQLKGLQPISFLFAFKSVLAGQSVGFNTVNRLGEPVARAAFLSDGNRIQGVALSIVGNMAQIIATILVSAFALLYLRMDILNEQQNIGGIPIEWIAAFNYLVFIGISVFILAYFKLKSLFGLIRKIPFVNKYQYYFEKLESFQQKDLWQLLWLSFIRYGIFIVQYYLLLTVFNVTIQWLDAFALISVLLMLLSIIPTIAFAELGIRGKLSLILFGLVSNNMVGMVVAAAGIWLINLILPAIAGTLFILGIQIFRNK
jgi:hypothetical protein